MDRVDVYVGLSIDFLHNGHIELIEFAQTFGEVTVGLLSDQAVLEQKSIPVLNYEQRKKIALGIKGVKNVVEQSQWDYTKNLLTYKPRYFVHGDDWKTGSQVELRNKVITALNSYGGELKEKPYTQGVSISEVRKRLEFALGNERQRTLRRIVDSGKLARIVEVHSPISALVAENAVFEEDSEIRKFDGFWSSSLADSTFSGYPDNESLSFSKRLQQVADIFEVTSKPLIFDADTGGQVEHFLLNVRTMKRIGVAACIIEDKMGLKKNSLFGNEVLQTQADPVEFANKITLAKNEPDSENLMLIARVESLILEKGMADALNRSKVYVDAGADGIMIHSRSKELDEVKEFIEKFKKFSPSIPLVLVPTTYNSIHENIFEDLGVNVLIYANHQIRASILSMMKTCESILKNQRSLESEESILAVKSLLDYIPGTR